MKQIRLILIILAAIFPVLSHAQTATSHKAVAFNPFFVIPPLPTDSLAISHPSPAWSYPGPDLFSLQSGLYPGDVSAKVAPSEDFIGNTLQPLGPATPIICGVVYTLLYKQINQMRDYNIRKGTPLLYNNVPWNR